MAKDTVEAVRQAELNATTLERDATLKSEEMIQNALVEAKKILTTRTKEALESSARELEQTNITSENLLKDAVLRAEQEIQLLKELVKSKEKPAIELVLAEVI